MRTGKALFGAWIIMLFAAAANVSAAEADLSGAWNLEIVSPQGTRTPSMVLTQAGTQVSGTYKSQRGEVPVNGTIQGNEFSLKVKIATQTEELLVEYKGRIEGNALNGRAIMGARGEANFTGKRAGT
jgi:hypothetical protein